MAEAMSTSVRDIVGRLSSMEKKELPQPLLEFVDYTERSLEDCGMPGSQQPLAEAVRPLFYSYAQLLSIGLPLWVARRGDEPDARTGTPIPAASSCDASVGPIAVQVATVSGEVLLVREFAASTSVAEIHVALAAAGVPGASVEEGAKLLLAMAVLDPSETLRSKESPCNLCFVRDAERAVMVELGVELLALLDELLLSAQCSRLRVMYLRLQADVSSCLAIFSSRAKAAERYAFAKKCYEEAAEISAIDSSTQGKLSFYDPIRLGLALTYAAFCHDVLHDVERGCFVARMAFEGGIAELDAIPECWYRTMEYFLTLLDDALAVWIAEDRQEA